MITIRQYEKKDVPVVWTLIFHTIRNINIRDYTLEQVKAWAPDHFDIEAWQERIDSMNSYIAELDGKIVGFADLRQDGYIDHFFCHVNYQRVGVGRALMEHIFLTGNGRGISRYYSAVSVTARPFYERFGFRVIKEQQAEINGQMLINFIMEKSG